MASYVCEQCGERNTYGTTFCVSCGAFLAWEDDEPSKAHAAQPQREPQSQPDAEPEAIATVLRPPVSRPTTTAQSAPTTSTPDQGTPEDTALGLFQVLDGPSEVRVPVTGEPASVALRVTNVSDIVDGYLIEAPAAPPWLAAESSEVRLLPGTDEPVSITLRIRPGQLVPAQQVRVVLRLRSVSQPAAHRDVPVLVIVPVLDVPVRLRAEPRLLRVRDRDTAEFTVVVDNANSNQAVQVQLSGADPELAVRFRFDPPVLRVGPGTTGAAHVIVTAPMPEPGQEASRTLTVTATDPVRSTETMVTLQQSTTAKVESPVVTLEVEPGLLRVRDTTVGVARITADNRGGTEWAHLQFRVSDPERLVRVTWTPPQLHVPPGGVAQVEARFEAPLPEAGTEVSRTVTITATDSQMAGDGRRTSTASATFVQVSSASPMSTLTLRVEPSVLRVRDTDSATVQVVLDNRRGRSGVRVALAGNDPERAIGFTFAPVVVDVPPGQQLGVPVTVRSYLPDPGQEVTRPFTVVATDNLTSVESSGSLVLASSRSPMELLTVRLDPSVVRLENRRRGSLTAVVDNRNGAQPVRVSMQGDDPENAVQFSFSPSVLDIPPGRVARTVVSVRAPRPSTKQELTRPFLIAASDDRSAVQSEGSIIQSSADRRPLARVLFTLFGALAMIVGTFLPWLGGLRGVDLDASAFQQDINLGGFEDLITVGLAMIGLGFLVLFGLTGRSGRLTRFAAGLGILLMIALFVVVAIFFGGESPEQGAVVVFLGCIAGYIGGLLRPR